MDVRFLPLGKLICITGVSGSGKSSLINEVLYKALAMRMYRAKDRPGRHETIEGIENLDKVVEIDQSPIGRTLPEPRRRTRTCSRTSATCSLRCPRPRCAGTSRAGSAFNVKGGRCEACQGDGIIRIEMQFLPDVYVPCEVCHGKRHNREALEIAQGRQHRGRTRYDRG